MTGFNVGALLRKIPYLVWPAVAMWPGYDGPIGSHNRFKRDVHCEPGRWEKLIMTNGMTTFVRALV